MTYVHPANIQHLALKPTIFQGHLIHLNLFLVPNLQRGNYKGYSLMYWYLGVGFSLGDF